MANGAPWLALLLVSAPVEAQHIERGAKLDLSSAPVVVQLDAIPTSSLVVMLMRDVMKVPYVISPDVLADRRPVSVKLVMPRSEVPVRVVTYLRKSGFSVELNGGTVYVSRISGPGFSSGASVPFGAPVASPVAGLPSAVPVESQGTFSDRSPQVGASGKFLEAAAHPELGIVAYVPAHRSPDYLSTIVQAVLPDLKFGSRADVKADVPAQQVRPEFGSDVLVMTGSPGDLAKARKLCVMLDRPRPLVAVKAVVMQVSDIRSRGSALSILASLGGGRVSAGSFSPAPTAAQFVRIGTGALSAVLSAVREDTRFKVVATPNLTALSGAVATMNSGNQVPTVGAVVAGDNGPPVQSIEYRDSGITLTVRPVVRGDLIEMDVQQERSTFVKTATGVSSTPTLQKVSASASVVLKSGESVALAGLTETSNGNTRQGIFGGLLGVRSHDTSDSELVVLLTAELVPLPKVAPGQFFSIFDPEQEDGENGDTVDPLAPLAGRARAAIAARGQ